MPSPKKELKTKMVVIKMTPTDYEAVKKLAVKHAEGNISNWIRYASTQPIIEENK